MRKQLLLLLTDALQAGISAAALADAEGAAASSLPSSGAELSEIIITAQKRDNLYATYQATQAVNVRAYVRNLSNTDYILGVDGLLGGVVGAYNPPRTYGAEVTVSFR
jgi:hypothetical protein